MTTHRLRVPNILAFTLMSIFAFAFSASAEESEIALPGDRAYPESISAGPDNTLYVGSLAMGGRLARKARNRHGRTVDQASRIRHAINSGRFGRREGEHALGVLK